MSRNDLVLRRERGNPPADDRDVIRLLIVASLFMLLVLVALISPLFTGG